MSRIPNGVRVQSNKNPSVTFNALDNACSGRLNPLALKLWKDMLNVLQWEPDCRFRLEEERVAILDFLNNALQINATVLVYSSTSFIFDNSDTLILEGGEKGHLQDRAKISTYQEGRLTSKRVLIGLPDLVFALTGGDVEFGILAVTKDAFYVPDFIDRESGPEYGWGQSVEEISTETETKTEIKSQENKTMSNVKTTTVAVMAKNKSAAVTVAKLEAGRIGIKQVSKIVTPKLPVLVRGYADTPIGRLVMANLFNFAAVQFAGQNKAALLVADAMLEGAMLEMLQSFNIEELIDDVVNKVDVSKFSGQFSVDE